MNRLLSFLAIAGAVAFHSAVAQEQSLTIAGRHVVVWRPPGWETGRKPVIIFSHGYGGCATQSRFLTAGLAEHGYWVFALDHRDARCGQADASARERPDAPFRQPEKWSDRSFVDRADDIRAVEEALAASQEFGARLDFTHEGYAGHSLGGYTVVGLAGGWPSWKKPNVKAVLALSPYIQPFVTHHTLSGLTAPIMYQGGTLDFGITPWLRRPDGAYDASPAPKYFVEFVRAGHLAWTNLRDTGHDAMLAYAVAFFDRYLNGAQSGALTVTRAGVAELRVKEK